MQDNHLKRVFARGDNALGLWAELADEVVYEALTYLDYDWVLIDTEHGFSHYEDVIRLLRAMRGATATPIVRVPMISEYSVFKRLLDAGVGGVMVPLVHTAEQVEQVVSACKYPPRGIRGLGAHRAHGYGLDFFDYFSRANDETLVIAQVETLDAVDNIDAIAAVEGLDALFVGPADLSIALGKPFDTECDEYRAVIAKVMEAGNRAGKPVGCYCHNAADAKAKLAQGFSIVNVCNDKQVIVQGIKGELAAAREA